MDLCTGLNHPSPEISPDRESGLSGLVRTAIRPRFRLTVRRRRCRLCEHKGNIDGATHAFGSGGRSCLVAGPAERMPVRMDRGQRERRKMTPGMRPEGQPDAVRPPHRMRTGRRQKLPLPVQGILQGTHSAPRPTLLRIINHMPSTGELQRAPETDHGASMVMRNALRWFTMLRKHGFLSGAVANTTEMHPLAYSGTGP